MSAMISAVSGLGASSNRLLASASNLANLRSRGPVPEAAPAQEVRRGAQPAQAQGAEEDSPRVYQAVQAVQTSREDKAGVRSMLKPSLPSFIPEYDPDSAYANADGMVAAPNVDPVREMVSQMEALRSFRANMATVRTAAETEDALLNLKA